SFQDAARALAIEQLDGIDQVIAKRAADLASLQDTFKQEQEALGDNYAAKAEMTQAYEEERSAIISASVAEEKALKDQAADEESARQRKTLAETKAAQRSVAASTADMLGQVSGYLSDAASKEAKQHRKTAMTLFALSKAAAIASAIVNTALAVTQALGSAPPPYSFILAAISAAAGAAEIGVIAAQQPTFHAGGMIDEVPITALRGEAVLNRQAVQNAGGPGAIEAMNSGQGASGGGGVTLFRIGRMEAREIARTDIRANGVLPQTMRKIARNGGNPAGISNRRTFA
ncbi:MAG: hypothetical protein RLZZ200_2871, partial [Pseudomonadota bacterium]